MTGQAASRPQPRTHTAPSTGGSPVPAALQVALQHVREKVAGAQLHRVPAQRLADLRHRDPQQRPGVTLAHPAPWTPPQSVPHFSPPPPPSLSRAPDSFSKASAAGDRPLRPRRPPQSLSSTERASLRAAIWTCSASRWMVAGAGSTSRVRSGPMRKLRPL